MLRASYFLLLIWFVSLSGCARSALPLSIGSEAAGAQAQAEEPSEEEPGSSCDGCIQDSMPKESLRCLCRLTNCPTDLRRAASSLRDFAAYATGCGYVWFVRRVDESYDLFVYELEGGKLVYGQHSVAKPVMCSENSTLLLEGGQTPQCEAPEWCRFAHVDYVIGVGELDTVDVCDERTFR
jgi:hypothetical protein